MPLLTGPHPAVAAVRRAVRLALADLVATPRPADPGVDAPLVLAACSGGADSGALADALAFVAPRLGLRAGAVTVDHGLRADSADRTRELAARLRTGGLDPVEVATVVVGVAGGPEAAARSARYEALTAVADRLGAAAVLLGHTLDDQAETVLLGLARGSGTRSLSGMATVRGVFRRPLLELTRDVTRAACAAAGTPVWEDPDNGDTRFARVRVRSRVLPVLEAELGPGVAAALARTATAARADADALDALAAELGRRARAGPAAVDCAVLLAAPAALRRRVLRTAAVDAGAPPSDLAAGHVEALEALVTDWHGQGPLDLPGAISADRRDGRLHLAVRTGR